jgi:hypothetical protein
MKPPCQGVRNLHGNECDENPLEPFIIFKNFLLNARGTKAPHFDGQLCHNPRTVTLLFSLEQRETARCRKASCIPLGAPLADRRGLRDALEDTFLSVLQQPT